MTDDDRFLTSRGDAATTGSAIEPGTLLVDRYEILDYVGKGGMCVVYKAYDRALDETVAIKILRQQLLEDPSMKQRFLTEIKLARRVTHRNVCRIHDYGRAGSLEFISMQFVEGIELARLVRLHGGLSAGEAYEISLQLVDGLEAIHHQGIVHRDLKTSNVMVDRSGTALLMDFGIAKLWEGGAGMTLTVAGQIIGTPAYMSPEQAQGEPLDARSDIYAFGVVLFEMFTGALPFTADAFAALLYKKLHEPLPLDSGAAAKLPAPVKPVIAKALATAAADRYPSTQELRTALLEARAATPVDARDAASTIVVKVHALQDAPPMAARPAPPRPRAGVARRWATIGLTLAAVGLIAIGIRAALPFFRSIASQAGSSAVTTTILPPSSAPRLDSTQTASNTEAAITAPPGTNASSNQPPAAVPSAKTVSDRETDACGSGDAAACVALALAAETTKDFRRAADFYLKACNGKAAAGCTGLGVLQNRGLGVTADAAQAAESYERGCTLGDPAGCNNLGTLYQFGSLGFRDPAKAAVLYDRSCANGHMDGCANLGLLYLDTPGATPQEKQRARELLTQACAAGLVRACGKVR